MRNLMLCIIPLILLSGCVDTPEELNETIKDYSDTSNLTYNNNNSSNNISSEVISPSPIIKPEELLSRNITIASFNSDDFNLAKSNNEYIMTEIVKMIKNYDIIAIQGIKDSNGMAVNNLMSYLPEYNYRINGEYMFIYKSNVKISRDVLYDVSNKYAYAPYLAEFTSGQFEFVLAQIRVDELNAQNEIKRLIILAEFGKTYYNNENVFILGDLKADCNYYEQGYDLTDYDWLIKNNVDTTTTSDNCAYDRIISIKHYDSLIKEVGVYDYVNIDNELEQAISSHYPIYFRMEAI